MHDRNRAMTPLLRPILTMGDIYGPGLLYAPRAHSATSQWVSQDPTLLDCMCGNQQTILGEMPYITSAATASPQGMELISEAGLNSAQPLRTFRSEAQAIEQMHRVRAEGWHVVVQHLPPSFLFPEEFFWISPKLVSYLNNKGNLAEFAAPTQMPHRRKSSADAIFRHFPRRPFPFVLKVPTDLSTGAGGAVAVCRTQDDLAAAASRFANCERLIVESFLSITENFCLHHA